MAEVNERVNLELNSEEFLAESNKLARNVEVVTKNLERLQAVSKNTSTAGVTKMLEGYKKVGEQITALKTRVAELSRVGYSDSVAQSGSRLDGVAREYTTAFDTVTKTVKTDIETIRAKFAEAFANNNTSGIKATAQELQVLRSQVVELKGLMSDAQSAGVNTSSMQLELQGMENQMTTMAASASANMKAKLASGIKSGLSGIVSSIKSSLFTVTSVAKKALSSYFGLLKNGFTNVISFVKKSFSSIFSTKFSGNGLLQNLKQLLPTIALGIATKKIYELADSAQNMEGTLSNVFSSSADDVREWSTKFASSIAMTETEARNFATQFGQIFSNTGIDSNTMATMSKNLTVLTADMRSFYGVDKEEASNALQSYIKGNTKAMKAYGVVVNDATLKQFALDRGYSQAYDEMSNANKAIVRYNYLLSQTAQIQDNAQNSLESWTNQTSLLKNNLSALGSYLGGAFIKVLQPVVVVVNQLLGSLVTGMKMLAEFAGFDPVSISEITGSQGNTADATEGLEDEANAIDDVADASKKASKNLQSFDKLNNLTSDTATSSSPITSLDVDGIVSVDSYLDSIEEALNNSRLSQYFSDLWKLIGDKNWKGAGSKLASGFNSITNSLNKLLKSVNESKIDGVTDSITDFVDGLLDIDTSKLGENLGLGVNIITGFINSLYETANNKGMMDKAGKSIYTFVSKSIKTIKWKDLGKSLTTGARALLDVFHSFITEANENDLGFSLGSDISSLISGMVERYFGNGGAEKLGESIGNTINFVADFISGLFADTGNGSVVKQLADNLGIAITKAVETVDPKDVEKALINVLNGIGDFTGSLAGTLNNSSDKISDTIAGAINGAADSGSLSNAVKGIASLFLSMIGLIGETIKKIDWSKVASEIWRGISGSMKDNPEAVEFLSKALAVVFGVKLISKVASFGLNTLGSAISNSLASSISSGLASSASTSTIASGLGAGISGAASGGLVGAGIVSAVATVYDWTKGYGPSLKLISKEWKNCKEAVDSIANTVSSGKFEIPLKNTSGVASYVTTANSLLDSFNKYKDSGNLEYLEEYLGKLEKAGYNNTDAFNSLKTAYERCSDGEKNGWLTSVDAINAYDNLMVAVNGVEVEIEGVRQGLGKLDNTTLSNVQSEWDNLKNNVSNGTEVFKQAGSNSVDAYVDGMKVQISTKSTTISGIFSEIGKNITQGLSDGIVKNSYNVIKATDTLCSGVSDKTKGYFGIHSPSRLFAEYGKYIDLGLAEGITDNAEYATDEINTLSSLVDRAFSDNPIDMSNVLDITNIDSKFDDVLGVATSFSDDIQKQFSSMLLQPSFSAKEMQAVVSQNASNSGLSTGLSNIYAKLGSMAQQSGRNMQVSVYLDANNKLGDFIIDTVNGKAISGGRF